MSLFDYFKSAEINNYKYVIYFNEIDLDVLNNNQIEYLSTSYEYYVNLEEAMKEILDALNLINLFIIITSIFYSYKIVKKKIDKRSKDILFFKASGIKLKHILKISNKDNKLIILFSAFFSFVLNVAILAFLFEEFEINFVCFFLSAFFSLLINKKFLRREIERKIRI